MLASSCTMDAFRLLISLSLYLIVAEGECLYFHLYVMCVCVSRCFSIF